MCVCVCPVLTSFAILEVVFLLLLLLTMTPRRVALSRVVLSGWLPGWVRTCVGAYVAGRDAGGVCVWVGCVGAWAAGDAMPHANMAPTLADPDARPCAASWLAAHHGQVIGIAHRVSHCFDRCFTPHAARSDVSPLPAVNSFLCWKSGCWKGFLAEILLNQTITGELDSMQKAF